MKKHLILSVTMLSAVAFNAQAMVTTVSTTTNKLKGNDVYGHTFLSVRPEFESAFPEKTSQFRDRAMARCDGNGGAFQFVAFGGQSVNARGLMKYFSPSGQTSLVVNSNPATGGQSDIARDINPLNFGISYLNADGTPGTFSSVIQFRPKRSVGGLGITYRQYVGRECDVADRQWFFELSAPILHVRNKMNLTETNVVTTGAPATVATAGFTSPANMTQAFMGTVEFINSGTTMQYGLINDISDKNNPTLVGNNNGRNKKPMSATGSDIELKLGYDYYNNECCHFDGYVGLHIPASRKPNARYVFEAIPGFNQHFGFMLGGSSGIEVHRNCDRSLSIEAETNVRYFVRNTQLRSFD